MLTGIITYLVSANDKLCELSYNSQKKNKKKKRHAICHKSVTLFIFGRGNFKMGFPRMIMIIFRGLVLTV